MHKATFEYLTPTEEQIKAMQRTREAAQAYSDVLARSVAAQWARQDVRAPHAALDGDVGQRSDLPAAGRSPTVTAARSPTSIELL
jgi:hypothetical protein